MPAVLSLAALALPVHASEPGADLARQAEEPGTVSSLVSSGAGPVGVAGLWGIDADFVAARGCRHSFAALGDVESYPDRSDKVKRVDVLERKEGSLLVDYTEGAWGLEATSTMLWTYRPDSVPPAIVSETVGEGDARSWMEIRFHGLDDPGYCRIGILLYADISWLPKFLSGWMTSVAGDELVSTYRSIILSSSPAGVAD